ncbi:conserved hypothetical protein [Rhodopseudomonas palustris HaA2]|uniref:Uncharacterized protein n=1 Tax=Rhodopseudomonas palustris (strain HaA2) TaxID=316058 RepID=Q2J0B1_RHOP2|nr:hypothetical protein [Rhodopseudomonas palustris]ABD06099.1 conserved hypothetical protein [Rhodopseudomonas palustris HaA2]
MAGLTSRRKDEAAILPRRQERQNTMSQIVRGVLGAIAITGTLGVAQLAVGGDLGELRLERNAAVSQDINRGNKTDRAAPAQKVQPGQTFGVNLVDQSVLVRVPDAQVGQATRIRAQQPAPTSPRRTMVACEPVVSVLTEVAKRLEPGRCVT